MLFGSRVLFQCPSCTSYIYTWTMLSANMMGAVRFSDGNCISRLMPVLPNLTKCTKCGNFMWLDKIKVVGRISESLFWGTKEPSPEEYKYTDETKEPTLEEYLEALDRKVYDDQKDELYIRVKIWRGYHLHIWREKPVFSKTDEVKYRDNLLALAALKTLKAESKPEERISLAEVYRNLGEFDKCSEILEGIEEPKLQKLIGAIRAECEKKNWKGIVVK